MRYRITLPFCIILGFALIGTLSALAEGVDKGFDAANKLYEEGKFQEAAAAYEGLVKSGQKSAAIYFNLGNANFKSGRIGRAIAAYRHAEVMTPRDPDVRANLQFARNQVSGPTLLTGRWQRVLGKLTLNEWTFLASVAIWLCFLLLAFLQWRPALWRSLRGLVITFALAAAISGTCLATAFYEKLWNEIVTVVSPEAVVHNGPLEESQSSFTVHDGAELRLLDRKEDWLQVSPDPRRVGWLRRDQVLFSSQD
jgi:tetratricopeptide (TPR) repeat protein